MSFPYGPEPHPVSVPAKKNKHSYNKAHESAVVLSVGNVCIPNRCY